MSERVPSCWSENPNRLADLQTYLIDNLMLLLDRTSMAVSVEARVPFLDHRLVEAALSVPPAIRTPNDRQKGLQRAIASRWAAINFSVALLASARTGITGKSGSSSRCLGGFKRA